MIEPTDEMEDDFARAAMLDGEMHGVTREQIRAGLAAVLAIVERDYPASEYTVSALPEDDINARHFQITVAYRGRGLWAVSRHRHCLGRSGEWDWESIPSERSDEWLTEHRFPLHEALRLAREELPKLRCNGLTAAEVAAWVAQRRAEREATS